MTDFLDLDLSKCELKLPHPDTGLLVPASKLTPEQREQSQEDLYFDEEIRFLVETNQLKVSKIISPIEFSL